MPRAFISALFAPGAVETSGAAEQRGEISPFGGKRKKSQKKKFKGERERKKEKKNIYIYMGRGEEEKERK